MKRVRKALLLPANRQLLLVVTSVLFLVFTVTVRVGSLRANEAFARHLGRAGLSRWSVENADWALSIVESNFPGSGGCLPAAMVGMAITDESLELQVGVRDKDSSIEAHAWLECPDGRLIFTGEAPTEFRRLEE